MDTRVRPPHAPAVASRSVRSTLFDGDRLEYRFATPDWRARRRVPREALLADLEAADLASVHRLTLSGGDPLAHPAFADVVTRARALGAAEVAVETEARALERPGATAELMALGVGRLFLHVGGVRARVHDAVMADEGSLVPAMRGLANALACAVPTYVVVPVLKWNLDDLVPLADWLLTVGRPRGVLLALPRVDSVPDRARSALVPFATQAVAAANLFRHCQVHGIEHGFHSPHGIAPCAAGDTLDRHGTVFHDRVGHYKRAPDVPLRRIAACESCSLRNACAGIETAYVEAYGTEGLAAVPLDRSMNWKLRPLHHLEPRDYKNVSDFDVDDVSAGDVSAAEALTAAGVSPGESTRGRALLRINGHCNMSCAFCFVDRTAPDFAVAGLEHEIDRMAAKNPAHLVLSGGEPTIHPGLPRLIAHAKARGFRTIEIQSNGVRAAEPGYARLLVDAGLTKVTVSLHSRDPQTSDMITRLPNAFHKTIRSMHNFRELGVETQVAHVLTKANYEALPGFMRFLRDEFPRPGAHLSVCLAIAQGISDLVFEWVIPRFTDIKPFVREALDLALESDIGFGGMLGQGGYPPCMLDGEMKYYERVLPHIYRSADHDTQFHKEERCRECSFDSWCVGVRRSYVECYGTDEIRPFRADIRATAPRAQGRVVATRSELIVLRRKEHATG